MKSWICVAAAALVASCGTFTGMTPSNPPREVVGFVVHDPAPNGAAPGPAAEQKLDWETAQTCTHGVVAVTETEEPAENDAKLADRLARCRPYGFSMLGVSFAGLVPF
jgi:hypothetical protein